jgi:hypothetical protein
VRLVAIMAVAACVVPRAQPVIGDPVRRWRLGQLWVHRIADHQAIEAVRAS